ncbi:MAG: nitroreductase family protein [Ruminococcaceae bacterium]|nr:nitroreductase family protein [Oscillospiraceae bacterium]
MRKRNTLRQGFACPERSTMTVHDAVHARRTIRKFTREAVPEALVKAWIDGARLSPCSANQQPLKYKLLMGDAAAPLLPFLRWAVMIAPQLEPKPEELPPAFVVIAVDTAIRAAGAEIDVGIAAQTIALLAEEQGVASALLSLRSREVPVRDALHLPEQMMPALAIALGHSAMEAEAVPYEDTHKYRLDEDGKLLVPKRSLSEVLL